MRIFRIFFVLICSFFIMNQGTLSVSAAESPVKDIQEILLWPGAAPGSESVKLTETVTDDSKNPLLPNRNIAGIEKSSVTMFVPESPNGVAAVICPGGGYTNIVFDKEGTDIARWLNSFGVTAFVLKSRLPGEGHLDGKNVPLQDGQRAMRLVRHNAAQWGINPKKIGILGLSAGGHMAAMIGTSYDKPVYQAVDEIDQQSARPDFMILAYPPISTNARIPENGPKTPLKPIEKQEMYDEYPADLQVTGDTPKTFIVAGDNDVKVPAINSVRMYTALKKAGVPAELHIYVNAPHGFAIRNAKGTVKLWTDLCKGWMTEIGLFK